MTLEVDLAGGRGVEDNEWKAKKAWLMKGRVLLLQDILKCEGSKVGSYRLTKDFMCQVTESLRTISLQELVLVDDPNEVLVGRRQSDIRDVVSQTLRQEATSTGVVLTCTP